MDEKKEEKAQEIVKNEAQEEVKDLIDEETKKTTARNTIIAIISLVVIFALIFGVSYLYSKAYRNPYEYEYNNFQFKKADDGKWYTRLTYNNKYLTIPLTFGPRDVKDIKIIGKVDERFISREVYITFDPAKDILLPTGAIVKEKMGYTALAASELTLNLAQGIDITPIAACTKNDTACEGRPIITCEDGNATIYLKRSDETSVLLDGNCIILSGKDAELVKAVDRLLLFWYMIMP